MTHLRDLVKKMVDETSVKILKIYQIKSGTLCGSLQKSQERNKQHMHLQNLTNQHYLMSKGKVVVEIPEEVKNRRKEDEIMCTSRTAEFSIDHPLSGQMSKLFP